MNLNIQAVVIPTSVGCSLPSTPDNLLYCLKWHRKRVCGMLLPLWITFSHRIFVLCYNQKPTTTPFANSNLMCAFKDTTGALSGLNCQSSYVQQNFALVSKDRRHTVYPSLVCPTVCVFVPLCVQSKPFCLIFFLSND